MRFSLVPLPVPVTPMPMVTPFTYQDNASYLEVLSSLANKVEELTDFSQAIQSYVELVVGSNNNVAIPVSSSVGAFAPGEPLLPDTPWPFVSYVNTSNTVITINGVDVGPSVVASFLWDGVQWNHAIVAAADPGTITPGDIGAATAAQGALADTASQPGHVHPQADVAGLGSAALQPSTAFATAAQGLLADTASQPGHGHQAADVAGLGSAALQPSTAFATAAQGLLADTASQPGHVHPQADVAGLGSAALQPSTAFATAAQGSKADSASQPGHGHQAADVAGLGSAALHSWSELGGIGGRLAKNDGSQSIYPDQVSVTMALDLATGGVSFDSANGGGLKVPVAGWYLVSALGYCTGGTNYGSAVYVMRWRVGVSTRIARAYAYMEPNNQIDATSCVTQLFYLEANDIITLQMRGWGPAAAAYGGAAKDSCALTVVKIGA